MHEVWNGTDGDVLFRKVRWNGRPRARGDLWVTADGFTWRRGKIMIQWRHVVGFDVVKVGRWDTAGGRSLSVRREDDPRMLDLDVVGAIEDAVATGHRGMNTHLVVETRRDVHVFTSGERYKRVCAAMAPAISYFGV